MRVTVLTGGTSSERDVALASAVQVIAALRSRGHEVAVVDRRQGPSLETSYANGGQISVSHSEPWANPDAPAKLLKWLWREDSPLLFRLRMDPKQ